MMEFTAREWRQIWEYLYNHDDINIAGRIAHDVGHVWNNSEDWDTRVSLDFDGVGRGKVRNAAGEIGLERGW